MQSKTVLLILVALHLSFGSEFCFGSDLDYLQFNSTTFNSKHEHQIFDVANLPDIAGKKIAGMVVDVELYGDKAVAPEILKGIQYLKLQGSGAKIDDYLNKLLPKCPQLIHLHVRFKSGSLSEECLSALAESNQLKSLLLYAASAPLSTNVYRLKSLEELLIVKMENGLLPNGISGLPNLKRLMVFRSPKIELPEDLSRCTGLEVLELVACPTGNKLFDLLPPNLVALTAFRCELTELAFKQDALRSTRYLSLGDNEFKTIPQSVFAHGKLEIAMFDFNKAKIELLDFPQKGLDRIETLSFEAVQLGTLSERAEALRARGILRLGK